MSSAKKYLWSLVVVMLMSSASTVMAMTLEISPTAQSIPVGTHAQVAVWLKNPGGNFLSTYDFFLTYDPAILSYNTTSFSNALGNPASDPGNLYMTDSSTSGSLELIAFPLTFDQGLQSGTTDLLLLSLDFSTLAVGTSTLNFLTAPYLYLGNENGDNLQVELVSGSIDVIQSNPVPEPSTLLLLSAGIIGGILLKRKQNV